MTRKPELGLSRRRQLAKREYAVFFFLLVSPASFVLGLIYLYTVRPGTSARINPFTRIWADFTLDSWKPFALASLSALAALGISRLLLPPGDSSLAPISIQQRSLLGTWGILIALEITAKGPYFLDAPEYLAFFYSGAISKLALLSLTALGIFSGLSSKHKSKIWWTLHITSLAVGLSYASRAFALYPVMYGLGQFLGGLPTARRSLVRGAFVTLLLLPVPLILRVSDRHGLIGYIQSLMSLRGGSYDNPLAVLAENFGFSAAITSFTAFTVSKIPAAAIAASLNPIPGGGSWNYWQPQLRAHDYIPFSSLGELYNFSPALLCFFVFQFFLVSIFALHQLSKYRSLVDSLVFTAILGLCLVGGMYFLQYNTRSVFRIETMVIAAAIVRVGAQRLSLGRLAQKSARRRNVLAHGEAAALTIDSVSS
jgi:hypothetical protein